MIVFLTAWLGSLPGFMTPLLLASLGLLLCERAGVLNLGVEGVMAVAAMTGAAACLSGLAPGLSLVLAAGAAVAITLPYIIAVVVFRAAQIPAGLALVAIGLGTSMVLGRDFAHRPFRGLADLPFPGPLKEWPLVGRMLFQQDAVVYLALAAAALLAWMLHRTRTGLALRATGEDPATADSAGVDVQAVQCVALVAGSTLIGLAGGYLALGSAQIWTEGMVAGRGWIALALVVFVQWSPLRAIAGAALFGGAQALIPRLQALGLDVPIYVLAMMPYVLTIAVLVAASRRARTRQQEPGFLGRAYIRQDR
ncbi:ABC transporter permease [Meridianimarinicoccus roseus]|uniref:ABC transporter permease n=1 Tax=Meridianimarinicoccus roseus TaxID=2072018 RepID=A0A2V2LDZ7_9RHOB|nr:ABC transporter permease [Meridianimarinicoccus roseus]PWR03770.1 ABC transporter permease [Meridianimarinicoccus roseus]